MSASRYAGLARIRVVVLTALLSFVVGVGVAAAQPPGVVPETVSATLPPGGTLVVQKVVHTPFLAGSPSITVSFSVSCDTGLSVTLSPTSVTVMAGDDAVFVETIVVAPDAPAGTLSCAVTFLLSSAGGQTGLFRELIVITVLGHPATCEETTNPHGQNVPPAGSTTLPGPNGGQNEDGYYLLGSPDPSALLFVVDTGSGTVFGPFPNGTKIKYTQAVGATPDSKKIGSTNGEAGAVAAHINGTGDPSVFSSANPTLVLCLVPPPPK